MVYWTETWSTSTFAWLGKELFSSCYAERSSWSCSRVGKGDGDAEMSGCLGWHSVPSPTGGSWWHLPAVRGQNPAVSSRWPGGFEVMAAPEHSSAATNCSTCCDLPLLALMSPPDTQCPSLPLLHPWCCWQHPAGPQELQFYRTMMMSGQYKIPPSAELSPPPAGQLSLPAHGCNLVSGLLLFVPYKMREEEQVPKKSRFCPGQPFQDETLGKEVPLSTCQPTPPATHFLLLTLLFFVMLSACCLRWDERFLIVMAYSSRDKRVYFFLILDVLKTLYLHPATFKRRQKWNEANNFSAPLIKQPQMI